MKLNQVFVLFFVLFVIFDDTDSLFFGRRTRRKQQPKRVNPNNNKCYYDNQCSTGKCRRFDNIFCGIGSSTLEIFSVLITYFFMWNFLYIHFETNSDKAYSYSLQVNLKRVNTFQVTCSWHNCTYLLLSSIIYKFLEKPNFSKLEINFWLLLRNHEFQNASMTVPTVCHE